MARNSIVVVALLAGICYLQLAAQQFAKLKGEVIDAATNALIRGAKIRIVGASVNGDVTDSFGKFTIRLPYAVGANTSLRVSVSREGYETLDIQISYRTDVQHLFLRPSSLQPKSEAVAEEAWKTCEAFRSNSRWAEAYDACSRAITLKKDYANAYRSLCFIDIPVERFNEAVTDCARAVELSSPDWTLFNQIGYAYHHIDQYRLAISALTRALELSPKEPTALNNRALSFEKLGCTDNALADFIEAVRWRPGYPLYLENEGALLVRIEKYDEARNVLERAARLDQERPKTHLQLGRVYKALNLNEKSLHHFHRVIALDPGNAAAYFGRAQVHEALGNEDGAAADRSSARFLKYSPAANPRPPAEGCPSR